MTMPPKAKTAALNTENIVPTIWLPLSMRKPRQQAPNILPKKTTE